MPASTLSTCIPGELFRHGRRAIIVVPIASGGRIAIEYDAAKTRLFFWRVKAADFAKLLPENEELAVPGDIVYYCLEWLCGDIQETRVNNPKLRERIARLVAKEW